MNQKRSLPRMPLLVMVLAATVFSLVASIALIWENRNHQIEAASRENADIARLVSFHVSHVLRASVRLLDEVSGSVRANGFDVFRSEKGRQLLIERIHNYPELQGLTVADKNGQIVAASSTPFPPPNINYADREYFQRHLRGENLVVGELIVSRTLKRRGATISQAIRSEEGELIGVIVITIESAHFMDLFKKIQPTPTQSISVVRTDGAVFVRSPEVELGRRFPQAQALLRATTETSGTYFEPQSAIDGLPRFVGFEVVDNFPLVVVATQFRDDVLRPWWKFVGFVGIGLGLALTLLTISSAFAFRATARSESLQQELELQAHTDSLTGLHNRRHFMMVAEKELSRSIRYGGPIAVLMIDIDHFKRVNDTYGHTVGDLVLERLADLFHLELRDIDTVARMGGEEFAVLLPITDGARALDVAERLRAMVAATSIALEQGLPLTVTISVGVATLAGPADNIDTLLSHADTALYEAKHAGRNRVVAARPSPLPASDEPYLGG